MKYIKQVLTAIDQLGNALAGGNADMTISARVGHHAASPGYAWPWVLLETIINWAFEPVDGENHCIKALSRECSQNVNPPTAFGFYAVTFLVLLFTPAIGAVIRFIDLFSN